MDNEKINNIELLQEERIVSFLQGGLSPEEELKFQDELKKDPSLKEKAINMARLIKGLSQVGVDNDRVLKEAFLSSDEETIKKIAEQATSVDNNKSKTKKKSYKKYATILSMAASLLFIIYMGFLYHDYSKTTTLGEQYATKFETSIVRGEENPIINEELETLINNVYNKKDLGNTLKRLAVLWEVSTQETYNNYTDYAPQIGWALVTGYLKDNNKEEASVILKKMAVLYEANTAMGKRVRELQVELSD